MCRAGLWLSVDDLAWEVARSDRVFCGYGSLVFGLAARIVVALAWSQGGGLVRGMHGSRFLACGGVVLGDATCVNLSDFYQSTTLAFDDIV